MLSATERIKRKNVSDGVDIFERITGGSPLEMMTLGKDLTNAKGEPVMCGEEHSRQRGKCKGPEGGACLS